MDNAFVIFHLANTIENMFPMNGPGTMRESRIRTGAEGCVELVISGYFQAIHI
jgi:hypothetical protein